MVQEVRLLASAADGLLIHHCSKSREQHNYLPTTGRFSDLCPYLETPSHPLIADSGIVPLGFATGYSARYINTNPVTADAYSGATVADFNRVPI